MGSPAERRAMEFALERFRAAGCDTAYVIPFTTAGGVNTASGIAVGVKKGRTGRIIVLGGHIDSAGPEIPGANDDGSGTAVVLEAARVLAPRDNASTLLFCVWGGEERGLLGSEHFVAHFPSIDSVVLMLQVDMANGGRSLNVDPDAGRGVSAPSWLLEAAYDIYYKELGYDGLVYPSTAATLNTVGAGMYGSDHSPFIEAGIPAIDFTSDITDPIHTPLDRLENFDPSGLKRSGDLVVRLVERFDGGVPSRTTERYLPVQIGIRLFIIRYWVLWLFVAAAAVAALAALRRLRYTDKALAGLPRIRFSGLKAALILLVFSVFVWQSETLTGWLLGYRMPWVNNGGWYVLLGFLAALAAAWLCARLAERWPLGREGFPFMLRASLLFGILVLLPALGGPEGALFAAIPLFFFSLAVLVRAPLAKVLFALLAFLPVVALAGSEFASLLRRMLTTAGPPTGPGEELLREAAFVGISMLVFLPFAYGLAAVYRSREGDWLRLGALGQTRVLAVAGGAMALLIAFLATRPVYGGDWFVAIRAEQRGSLGDTVSLVTVEGTESLAGLRLRDGGRDTVFAAAGRSLLWKPAHPSLAGWATVGVRDSVEADGAGADTSYRVRRTLVLEAPVSPYTLTVTFRGESTFEASSPFVFRPDSRREDGPRQKEHSLRWYSFPAMPLEVPVSLSLPRGSRVVQTVELTFAALASGMEVRKENAYLIPRTVLTWRDTISAGGGP
jgi:hypothetical protein